MTARRRDALVAAAGAALFVVCSLVARGGPLDARQYGDLHLYAQYAHEMASGRWPYRDFFDEYPPLAQPLFLVVHSLPGSYTAAFRWTMAVLGAAALALAVSTLVSLGASRARTALAAAVIAVSPLVAGPVLFNHYDWWPALLAAAAVLALVRGRERTAYVLLALAVAAKVYPVVLLPLALVETWRVGGRDAVRRALAWFAGVLAVVHVPFAIMGPGGLRFSYWVQLKRGLQVESLAGTALLAADRLGLHHVALHDEPPGGRNVLGPLAGALAAVSTVVELAAVLLVAWLAWRRRAGIVLPAAAAVAGFVAFGKVFSPQYVVWLLPLVPLAGAVTSALLLAVLWLTRVAYLHYPAGSSAHDAFIARIVWWDFARDLLVVALYALLVRLLRRRPSTRSP